MLLNLKKKVYCLGMIIEVVGMVLKENIFLFEDVVIMILTHRTKNIWVTFNAFRGPLKQKNNRKNSIKSIPSHSFSSIPLWSKAPFLTFTLTYINAKEDIFSFTLIYVFGINLYFQALFQKTKKNLLLERERLQYHRGTDLKII